MNLSWDNEIDGEVRDNFLKWLKELRHLISVKIPRWISCSNSTILVKESVHIFYTAYATCILLKTENSGKINVRLTFSRDNWRENISKFQEKL